MKKYLEHMKKQFSETFDVSIAMSTDSQSVRQDSQDPNEDFNIENIRDTLVGE